jgi:hypothetical protein
MWPEHIGHYQEQTIYEFCTEMSASFHRRYVAGECDAVCRDLVSRGHRVFDSPLLDDAVAVANEIVDRSIRNLSLIHTRLTELGYHFADESAAFVVNDPSARKTVERFEDVMGQMPMLISVWYSRISSVNFEQSSTQLFDNSSDLGGLGWHAELVFQSLHAAHTQWNEYAEDVKRDHKHYVKQGVQLDSTVIPTLFTGGCASNCDAKGIELPCRKFDAVLYNDGGGDVLTVHEIRKSFAHAGFPILFQWESLQSTLQYLVPKPDIERLLPLLTRDLVDI